MPQRDLPWVTKSTGSRVREAARPGRLTTSLVAGVVVAALATTGVGTATHAKARPVQADVAAVHTESARSAGTVAGAQQAFGTVPVAFVANRGQTDPRVRYYAVGHGFAFFATRHELMLSLSKDKPARHLALALRFLNSNPDTVVTAAKRAPGTVNYLAGRHPSGQQTGLSRYRDIVYRNLWPRIDLRLHVRAGVLKYEFHVRPGGRVSDIRLAYAGARRLGLGADGALRIRTALGVLRDSRPVTYQKISGARVPVSSRFRLDGGGKAARFAFKVGPHQRGHGLVIDPGVQFTTFLGGNSNEIGAGIAVDGSGNSYVGGTTQSPNFPTTTGAFKRTGAVNNFSDVFVTKLNPAGTALIYSTFVGGSDLESGNGIAVDAAGNAYVTGTTKSTNFPTTAGAFDRTLNTPGNCPRCGIDNTDGFVFKLNAAGSQLAYSTYLGGGTDIDSPRGITVDGAGSAYVVGETNSTDFPTTAGAFRPTPAGQTDMFVTKLNPAGSALAYSTRLGGTQVDNGQSIAVDSGGNAYALGFTSSTDFPTTAGAFDRTANGGFDPTLTKLNPAGSALVYSTYLGGQAFDSGNDLRLDGAGNAYVAGQTSSTDFPTTPGAFDTTPDGADGFVTKVNATGSALVYSTVIGGSAFDSVNGIVLDPAGDAWLAAGTTSADFPVSADAADATSNGASDAVIAELNAAGSALPYATYLGGSQSDNANDIGRDSAGNLYVTGNTFSMDFPATVGAFDTVWNGDPTIFWGDAFVTKLSLTGGTTPPAPPAVPVAPTLVAPANGASPAQPVGFDWNDVTGAASYTIEIDDSSAFTAPLVSTQTVTSSAYLAGGLPAATLFWRVRALNTAGTPGPYSATRSVLPQAAPAPTTLNSLDINPAMVAGGDASSGTVVVSVSAPDTTIVSLSSSNPAAASVPATVTLPTGGFTGTFTIATSAVASSTNVVITATFNGSSRSSTLAVTGGSPPPAASLQSLVLSPSSVTGGTGAQAALVLSGAAPTTGAALSLSSSNPAVASVPASATVSGGSTSTTVAISTPAVSSSTLVTITASYGGVTRTAVLTVTPAAPPPQNATVTVTATGRSGERITSSPAGISVATGSSGSATFATGTSVTLSASRSAVWTGACSSSGSKVPTCTFTATGPSSVTANVQ
jgi:Beta-propeller repeat